MRSEWKEIPGYLGYWVTEGGTVLGRSGKIMKQVPNQGGYLRVQIRKDRKSVAIFVHKAVLLVFVGPCPAGKESRHKDGNKLNNHRRNLSWGTKLENLEDKRKHGTIPRGEKSGAAKLTEADVRAIRIRIRTATTRALGKEFGVSHTAIRRAANGMKWGHLK